MTLLTLHANKVRRLAALITSLGVMLLAGCALGGIRSADGWHPKPPPPPCKPIKVYDEQRACLDDAELQKWMHQNL